VSGMTRGWPLPRPSLNPLQKRRDSMKANRLRYSIAALGAAALASVAVVGGAGATAEQTSADKNIVQTAAGAGQFKTLIALAKQAGLAGALTAPGKLTVFAPTDKAFAKVPNATLRKLQRNKAQLRAVLLYHVVKGDVRAAQVVKLRRAKTLNGAYVRIGVKGSRVYLNRTTRVTKTDIGASNGTIHVIDGVLIPPAN
jgi:uncharacterized surface protein with fasciclin (FAS1) repeats